MNKHLKNILKLLFRFYLKRNFFYKTKAILEIEEKKSSKINSPDLIKLETSCRMNYAAAKSKLNDFEVVLI